MTGEPRGAVARHTLWQNTPWSQRGGLWAIYITHPGHQHGGAAPAISTAPNHRPTVLYLAGVKRGACLGCEWESGDCHAERDAVEQAHDHAWPAWRDLPAVRPPSSTAEYDKQVYARWLDSVKRAYPPGWLEAGGPIVTVRPDSSLARHKPGKAPGGGYDLAATYYMPKKRRAVAAQAALPFDL